MTMSARSRLAAASIAASLLMVGCVVGEVEDDNNDDPWDTGGRTGTGGRSSTGGTSTGGATEDPSDGGTTSQGGSSSEGGSYTQGYAGEYQDSSTGGNDEPQGEGGTSSTVEETPNIDAVCTDDPASDDCAKCVQENCSDACSPCTNGACGQEAELFIACAKEGSGDEDECLSAATDGTSLPDDPAANDLILCFFLDEDYPERPFCWDDCAPLPDDAI